MGIIYQRLEPKLFIGQFNFDTAASATQVPLLDPYGAPVALPPGRILRVETEIITAFNAGTTNTLVLGRAGATALHSYFADATDTAPTVQGLKAALAFRTLTQGLISGSNTIEVRAKYTWTGSAPTAGAARFMVWLLEQ